MSVGDCRQTKWNSHWDQSHRVLKEFEAATGDLLKSALLPETTEWHFLTKMFQERFRKQACQSNTYTKQIGGNHNKEQRTSG